MEAGKEKMDDLIQMVLEHNAKSMDVALEGLMAAIAHYIEVYADVKNSEGYKKESQRCLDANAIMHTVREAIWSPIPPPGKEGGTAHIMPIDVIAALCFNIGAAISRIEQVKRDIKLREFEENAGGMFG
jgi:hypothetical protein